MVFLSTFSKYFETMRKHYLGGLTYLVQTIGDQQTISAYPWLPGTHKVLSKKKLMENERFLKDCPISVRIKY